MNLRIRDSWLSLLVLFLTAGCYRHHLYVQQEWVDRNFLASTHVGTPDPLQANPPDGQRLLIGWDFPLSMIRKQLTLVTTVRLWDDTQEVLSLPVPRKRGYTAYFFPNKRILTYRVQVLSGEGKVLETWKHHFWTELIQVGDNSASARKSISSVSSHPIQGSVIESP